MMAVTSPISWLGEIIEEMIDHDTRVEPDQFVLAVFIRMVTRITL